MSWEIKSRLVEMIFQLQRVINIHVRDFHSHIVTLYDNQITSKRPVTKTDKMTNPTKKEKELRKLKEKRGKAHHRYKRNI